MNELDFRDNLGKKIKKVRKKSYLSQTEFAQNLSNHSGRGEVLNKSAISRWEHGETVPSLYDFFKICHLFHIDVRWLLGISEMSEDVFPLPNSDFPSKDELLQRLGRKIKASRIERNLRLEDVKPYTRTIYSEQRTALSTIWNWENGVCEMKLTDLYFYCKRFNLDPNHLLDA